MRSRTIYSCVFNGYAWLTSSKSMDTGGAIPRNPAARYSHDYSEVKAMTVFTGDSGHITTCAEDDAVRILAGVQRA